VYTDQRLNLSKLWEGRKAHGRNAKVSNRTREIRPSGTIGGRRETSAMVGMCTAPRSKERETETPHLQLGAPDYYPNRRRKSEATRNTNFDLNRRASLRPYPNGCHLC